MFIRLTSLHNVLWHITILLPGNEELLFLGDNNINAFENNAYNNY